MMARNTILTLRTGNLDVSHGICHRCSRVLIAELDRPPAA